MPTDEDANRGPYLLDWLKQPGNLRIAEYQRAYCWPESFITNFVKTFLAVGDDSGGQSGPEDIGHILLETHVENGMMVEEIADGQQRVLTFALLAVELLGVKEFPDPSPIEPAKSRIRSLLQMQTLSDRYSERPFLDIETLVRADEACGIIRKIVTRLSEDARKAAREKLRCVTVGITPIMVDPTNAKVDRCVERQFEALNTTAKPLNGGQILKARHYGSIADPDELFYLEESWQNISRVQDVFAPVTDLLKRNRLTNDEFVDAPNQDAWYWPGKGFVQSVQAILLGQDEWRHTLNMQGSERLDPFDRMEGIAAPSDSTYGDTKSAVIKHGQLWRADAPLDFAQGWGFFGMVGRLGFLYVDLAAGYESLLKHLEEYGTDSVPVFDGRNSLTRIFFTAVYEAVQTTAQINKTLPNLSDTDNELSAEDLAKYRIPLINALTRNKTDNVADLKTVKATLNDMLGVRYWLGFVKNEERGENSSGCVLTAVFSVLLCWIDRFGSYDWKDDTDPLPTITEATERTLTQLALWMILAARFDRACRYSTVLGRLHTKEAVEAARFSYDLDNAWWRFMKLVRNDGGVKNFFVGLRDFFDKDEVGKIEAPHNLRSLFAAYLD